MEYGYITEQIKRTMDDTTKCPQCGKTIKNVEYIRYGGTCSTCWHKNNLEKSQNLKKK